MMYMADVGVYDKWKVCHFRVPWHGVMDADFILYRFSEIFG